MNKKTSALVGFEKHNHGACTENAINSAEEYCTKNNIKLTPIRKKVLELLLQEHRALGAYAILAMLREQGFSNQPPVAYALSDRAPQITHPHGNREAKRPLDLAMM